jgi:PTS system nitrogen regulatory IIA component
VRNPILLHVPAPFVTLCLLHHPVQFDAVDGKPVHALFSVISPTVPAHLRILAQLAVALRDGGLRQLLSSRASADRILSRVRALEARASGTQVTLPEPA